MIGGGFGGLAAAKALARAPVRVTLVDRHNYHLFQPLLYQVATATLSISPLVDPLRYSDWSARGGVKADAGCCSARVCGRMGWGLTCAADFGRSAALDQVASVTQRRMLKAIAAMRT